MNKSLSSSNSAPLRDLSNFDFKKQHWWGDCRMFKKYKKNGKVSRPIAPSVAKAALIYEAMRRRSEVQEAWKVDQNPFNEGGWEDFYRYVIENLPKTWPELEEARRQLLVEISQSPWFIPPLGYSTFPDKSEPEACRRASFQLLDPPEDSDPYRAQAFVQYVRRFKDAGFVIAAIDNKTKQSVRYAAKAIETLPRACRKQDVNRVLEHLLPTNISAEDRQDLIQKQREGRLRSSDLDEIWDKYLEPTPGLTGAWTTTAVVHQRPIGKRKRGDTVVEEMRFDFAKLFRELEDLDNGTIQRSDFVDRLRLS